MTVIHASSIFSGVVLIYSEFLVHPRFQIKLVSLKSRGTLELNLLVKIIRVKTCIGGYAAGHYGVIYVMLFITFLF